MFNLNFTFMLHFTITRSTLSQRVIIFNHKGTIVAHCESMNAAFDYFYNWCDRFGYSVSYFQTKDKNVIRVKIN